MLQQINLVKALPQATKSLLSPVLMIQICMIFTVLFLLLSVYQYIRNSAETSELAKLQVLQTAAQDQLTQAKANAAKLVSERQLMQQWLASNSQLLQRSNEAKEGKKQGVYLRVFTQLSKDIVPGVWLKNIRISQVDKVTSLTGSALNAVALVQFTRNLNQDPELQGMKFEIFNLNYPAANVQSISFLLTANSNG